jgi:hypothetical protein
MADTRAEADKLERAIQALEPHATEWWSDMCEEEKEAIRDVLAAAGHYLSVLREQPVTPSDEELGQGGSIVTTAGMTEAHVAIARAADPVEAAACPECDERHDPPCPWAAHTSGPLVAEPRASVASDKAACRRCTECEGQEHHWLMPDCTNEDGTPCEPFIPCKHCDARAAVCEGCYEGPALPGSSRCGECSNG